jgi:hypothetical protein
MPCIQEANLKYGRWMSGITTRHYANDLLSVLDKNPVPANASRRLVFGRGYGASLFDRAVMHARNEGVEMMFIHALSENTAMLNIARHSGAILQRDGAESDAYLRLRPADLDSRMTEMFEEHLAQTDYRLKVQAKQFWDVVRMMQEVRLGVRQAKTRTPS